MTTNPAHWLMPLMNALVALACGVLVLRHFLRAQRSAAWPRVDATITRSEVIGHGKGTRPMIQFDYTVDGHRLSSRKITVSWRWLRASGSFAKPLVARYPVGALVKAAYDPDQPSYGVLEPGVRAGHVLALVGAGVLALLFLLMPVIHAVLAAGR